MGHTIQPFTHQFQREKACFREFRRGLLLHEDQLLFDDLWDRAEFHIPAAEKAAHPLPIISTVVCMTLEQEKTIHQLKLDLQNQAEIIARQENKLRQKDGEIECLKSEIDDLRGEIERTMRTFREELLEILYPSYAA